jgi:hypothetical protein
LLERFSEPRVELGERLCVPCGGPCEQQPAQRDAPYAQLVVPGDAFYVQHAALAVLLASPVLLL